ncbi:11558_t:CDS:2, partial [Diversispora eburnea]
PTLKLLSDVFPQMLSALPKICFCVPKLTEEAAKFIDKLLKAEDVDDIPAVTGEEKTFRKLFSRILDSITMTRKNDLPEVEHTFRNVVPLLDATIGKDGYFWVKYGEQSLAATATRRNKERDPNDRARIGFKIDAMIEYQNLSWTPVISCLEVSGGLPQCSRSKEWDDTLKLGLELRDLWAIAGDHLMGVDVSELVWWGLAVIGRKIRVYAFASSGFLFHLVLMYEAFLPSSREDLYSLELIYLVLKEYKKKLDETKNMISELSKKK